MRIERVAADHRFMGGAPCVRGTRIPVATVAAGMTTAEIIADYPQLVEDDVRDSLRYAAVAVDERELMALSADTEPEPAAHFDGRPFMVDDLDSMPDDGHRYELIDGILVVSPAPSLAHQEAAFSLAVLLRAACPAELRVVIAPFEWRASDDIGVQPDILVARRDDLLAVDGLKHLLKPPVLAVEAISPSSRRMDRLIRLSVYEDAGVPYYWLLDPDLDEPTLTALELIDGRYEEIARITGPDRWTAERPFRVTVCPNDLVAGLRG